MSPGGVLGTSCSGTTRLPPHVLPAAQPPEVGEPGGAGVQGTLAAPGVEVSSGGEGGTAPTVLGAQQAVEDLLYHDGVEFDEFGQGLDHLFLGGGGG